MPRLSRSPPVSPRLAREAVSCSSLQTLQHCSGSTPSLSVDPTHRHKVHTFTRNCRSCHGGGKANLTRSLRSFCCILFTKNTKVLKSVSSGAPEPDTRQHSHINRRGSGEQPWRSSWPPPSTQHQPPAVKHCIEVDISIKLSFYIRFKLVCPLSTLTLTGLTRLVHGKSLKCLNRSTICHGNHTQIIYGP